MRFRRLEDEQRYHTLRTELWMRIVQALHTQPTVCQEVLRNLGKMEHAAFYEGVDQGAVAATVAGVLDQDDDLAMSSAADLHRKLYAHRDTPLTDAEAECWPEGLDMPYALTAPRPEYVPLTLAEALAQGSPPTPAAPARQDQPVLGSVFDPIESMALEFGSLHAHLDPAPNPGQPGSPRQPPFDVDRDASPMTLDRIRDALRTRAETGWKPTEWTDVILAVMEDTQIPAFIVDAQLATPQGDAVLKQAGLLDIEPSAWSLLAGSSDLGPKADLNELYELLQRAGAENAEPAVLQRAGAENPEPTVVSSSDADATEHEDAVASTPTTD